MKRVTEKRTEGMLLAVCFTIALSQTYARTFQPGDTVPALAISQYGEDSFFSCQAIPDSIFHLMQGRSYKAECTVPRDSLRYLLCLHRDAEGHTLRGEIVVHNRIAQTVLGILRQLYRASYPIQRMQLVDYWDADDERSMRANNSSGFNYRVVSRTHTVSKHGKGIAIDINPLYNPYVRRNPQGLLTVEPATGAKYADRSAPFPYKIEKGDFCHRLFTRHGFCWGGEWQHSKDYQHFELPCHDNE